MLTPLSYVPGHDGPTLDRPQLTAGKTIEQENENNSWLRACHNLIEWYDNNRMHGYDVDHIFTFSGKRCHESTCRQPTPSRGRH